MATTITINLLEDKELDKTYQVDYIIHISDIHIRETEDRTEEYLLVFNNLYKYLENLDNLDKSLIVITGDMIHTGTSKDCIKRTKDFIINLCKYTRVVLIAGNHDISTNNMSDTLDKMSAIIYQTETANPFYLLLNDGHYSFKNIIFGYTSLFSLEVVAPKQFKKKVNQSKPQIALYHGTVREIMAKQDKYTNSSRFSAKDFIDSGYDFVLLGDIHDRQIIKEKACYAGALIQQTKAESIHKGGYYINLKNKTLTPFNLDNPYNIIQIEVDKDGNMNIPTDNIPKTTRVEFINQSLNKEVINTCLAKLKQQDINITDYTVIHKLDNKLNTNISIGSETIELSSIDNNKAILDLVSKYITDNELLKEDKDGKQLKNLMATLQEILSHEKLKNKNNISHMKNITLQSLEYSNIAIYGEGNFLDFAKLGENNTKLVSLTGENDQGKSSVIDALVIAIFGKSIKEGNKIDIINYPEKSAYTEVILLVNKDKYLIRREYQKSKGNKITETVKIFKNDQDVSLQLKETYDYINMNIANMNDFMLTSIIKQNRTDSILSKGDFYNIVIKYSGLEILDNIKIVCKEIQDTIKKEIGKEEKNLEQYPNLYNYLTKKKRTNKSYESASMFDFDNAQLEIGTGLKEKQEERVLLVKQVEEITEKIMKNKIQRGKCEGLITGIKKPDQIYDDLDEVTEEKTQERDKLKETLEDLQEKLKDKKDKLKLDKYKNIKQEKEEFENKNKQELQEIKNKLVLLRKSIKPEEKPDNNTSIDTLKDKLVLLEEEINTNIYNKTLFTLDGVYKTFEEYIKYKNNELVEKIKEQITNKNKTLNSFIQECRENIQEEYDLIRTQDINKLYNQTVKNLDNLTKEKYKLEQKVININNYYNNIKIQEEITQLEESQQEIQDKTFTKYDTFMKIQENKQSLENKINQHNAKLSQLELLLTRLKQQKTDQEKYQVYDDNIKIINNLKQEIVIYEKDKLELVNKLNSIEYDIKVLEQDKIELDKYTKTNKDKYNKLDNYGDLYRIFNTGLVKNVLVNDIIPYVENSINMILKSIGYEEIKLIYNKEKEDSKEVYDNITIRRTNNDSLASRAGGFYYGVYDLIFRIVLSSINKNIKTNFLIIDEFLDGASENNKTNIMQILSYLRQYYKFVIIISHDKRIIPYMEYNLTITKDEKKYSHIQYPTNGDGVILSQMSNKNVVKKNI